MAWKVKYEKDGKIDYLFYGGRISEEDKNRRNQQLKQNGFKILSCYQVKRI